MATASNIDLQWLAERNSSVWTSCFHETTSEGSNKPLSHSLGGVDAWYLCLASFLKRENLLTLCPSAVAHSWPVVFTRLNALFSVVDPK